MLEFSRDIERTRAAYASGLFKDKKKRSHFNNLGHVFLRGEDRNQCWRDLYIEQDGRCATCKKKQPPGKLDMDHEGRTPKTRCDCFRQLLNNGTLHTGIALRCTMDVRKGGSGNSCHGRKHNREIKSAKRSEPAPGVGFLER